MNCSNFFKLACVAFLCILFVSCDILKGGPDSAGSGTAQPRQTIFSKTCADGSFTMSRTNTTAVAGTGLGSLNEGDKVHISGTATNAICYGGASVSFSCEASVAVGTRSFICSTGSVVGGGIAPAAVGTAGLAGTVGVTGATTGVGITGGAVARTFISGQFNVFQNGTQASASIKVSGPFGPCPISFVCQ